MTNVFQGCITSPKYGGLDFNRLRSGPFEGPAIVIPPALPEDTYFYFFCPKCPDREIMRILEYGEHAKEAVNEYNAHCKSKAKYGFTLVFKLYCEKCGHSDFVKLSNTGWQGGRHSEILR